jgi:DNA polymerase sigma
MLRELNDNWFQSQPPPPKGTLSEIYVEKSVLPNNPRLNNIQVDFQDFFVHYGICFIK